MKVSIIVPVYNVEEYLDKCLNSLVNQTLKDIEIIVVNDGTKDNSQDIIDRYVSKYPKLVKSYIKENGGLSSARNYGLKFASGEYIAFVDSDGYVELDMYEKMYNKAKKENLDIVVCDTINFYDDRMVYLKSNLNYSNDVIKNYIISPPMAPIRLYKRNIFNNQEFEEGIYYEDLNFTPSLVNITKNIGFIDNTYYYYRQRNDSIMHQTKFNSKLLDVFKVLDNNYKKLYKEYPVEVEYLYITHLLRTASLRFLDYDKSRENLLKINSTMKEKFPNWRKNIYYKKSSKKLKLICILSYNKLYFLLKLVKKIGEKR